MVNAGCSSEDLAVAARGRYVEIVTTGQQPVCDGTTDFIDAHLDAVAETLGESLPSGVFVRYEWADDKHAYTSWGGGRAVVESTTLPNEHELVHAVHSKVWPESRPFLHEGLAVLLGDSAHYQSGEWPADAELDALFEATQKPELDYYTAWFVVSQIVRDHGFDGLHQFWVAVPEDASAEEVRAAYLAIFDRPIDALLEPDLVDVPWMDEPVEEPRHTCYFAVCVGEATPWTSDAWTADAPDRCDGNDAIGPTSDGWAGDVWRSSVVDRSVGNYHYSVSGGASAIFRACRLRCDGDDTNPFAGVTPDQSYEAMDDQGGLIRVDVGRPQEQLPGSEPGGVEIRRLDP